MTLATIKIALTKNRLQALVLLVALFLSASCSSGGGGDSDSSATRDTAIRVLHGAVDATPISLRHGPTVAQTAYFSIVSPYHKLLEGQNTVVLEKANVSEGAVTDLSQIYKPKTEYTALVYGSAKDDTLKVNLIEDSIQEPASGNARVRLYNALDGNNSVSVTVDKTKVGPAKIGGASEYIEVPFGTYPAVVYGDGNTRLYGFNLTLNEKEEVSLLVTGALDLDLVIVTPYTDRD